MLARATEAARTSRRACTSVAPLESLKNSSTTAPSSVAAGLVLHRPGRRYFRKHDYLQVATMSAVSNPRKMLCPGCDRGMKLVQTIPQSGVLSEIVVFYCERCKHAETIAQKRAA